MDPARIQKFPARERCRKGKHFRPSLIQLSKVLFVGLFLSAPLWLPHVRSWRVSKCIFLLCNIVIVFCLAGESKLSCSSPTNDIYDEYMKANSTEVRSSRGERREKKCRSGCELGTRRGRGRDRMEWNEIDKKAEDFIARITWQRKLEERRLLSRRHG